MYFLYCLFWNIKESSSWMDFDKLIIIEKFEAVKIQISLFVHIEYKVVSQCNKSFDDIIWAQNPLNGCDLSESKY